MENRTAKFLKPDQAKTSHTGYVLIVGSEAGLLDYYRQTFAYQGFTPLTASTYEAAWALLRLLVFDLVVVDERGGTFEGRRVVERARELDFSPPNLAVNRGDERGLRLKIMSLRAVEYCPQDPVTIPEVLRLIDTPVRPLGQMRA